MMEGDLIPLVGVFNLGMPEVGCCPLLVWDFDETDEVDDDVDGRGDGVVGRPRILWFDAA